MAYDVVTVGGGLAGSALAISLTRAGLRVLVLESETRFRDRVRGEALMPWGVPEARALGIEGLLRDAGALPVPRLQMKLGPVVLPARDFATTTPHGSGFLDIYHPEMQEALLAAAADAGAEVRRGVRVVGVSPGPTPRVRVHAGRSEEEIPAGLVAGCDGRGSKVRRWAGFETRADPERLVIGGVLVEGMAVPPDTVQITGVPGEGLGSLVFPLDAHGRARCYYVYRKGPGRKPLSGDARFPDFVSFSLECGASGEWYEGARPGGPLAGFEGADHWVEHPYRNGVALVGDAAASSDPSWGQGLALTLRDVRVLRDALLGCGNRDEAGDLYAEQHDHHYGVIHTIDGWNTELLMEIGAEADAVRQRAFAARAADPNGGVDVMGLGPDAPCDEAARRAFFGEA